MKASIRRAGDLGRGRLFGRQRFADIRIDHSPDLRLSANSFTLIAPRRG